MPVASTGSPTVASVALAVDAMVAEDPPLTVLVKEGAVAPAGVAFPTTATPTAPSTTAIAAAIRTLRCLICSPYLGGRPTGRP